MTKKHLLELHAIKKVFHTEELETWALDDIRLTIDEGEYVAISGPSGCGKSTLLSVMGLLSSSTEGKYFIDGVEVASLGPVEQARVRNQDIGFIFQAFNLVGDMNVLDNVELPLTFRSGLSRKERKEMAIEALTKVDMAHRLKHLPAQLSGGQQQRVAIARALVGKPKVLLCDEPTGNLDSRNAEMVMELLDTLHKQGSTIVMVTHDPRSAEQAERKIMLFDGKVVEDSRAAPKLHSIGE
ncbi:ATP-binding cassette domain-containing protein [Janthinobacterium sp. FT14W]|uniref:ABC transporter ATP-binding protein n=1 Tax=Janthinobacterium sp. FT14W TaxID=2654253 RepID=UPI0012641279|nr:ABC transporter ATP-binding protein [Janthinobacterium sp. FT14W]KAB8061270.1 ATP-binding cassette domain-containing protein [Janthinobacterium sp. FT14W]